MTQYDDTPAIPAARREPHRLRAALSTRLQGPGGLYNAGNLLALAASLVAQASAAADGAETGANAMIRAYFFGSPGASWLTLAVVISVISGEVYHRAWKTPPLPDARLTRTADLLAGVAVTALALSLACYGDLVLAITSGALLAVSKFGNALTPSAPYRMQAKLCLAFRAAALVSRAPALAALATDLALSTASGQAPLSEPVLMPLCMIVCTLFWIKADHILLCSAGRRTLRRDHPAG